jgi:hypothetical protein
VRAGAGRIVANRRTSTPESAILAAMTLGRHARRLRALLSWGRLSTNIRFTVYLAVLVLVFSILLARMETSSLFELDVTGSDGMFVGVSYVIAAIVRAESSEDAQ